MPRALMVALLVLGACKGEAAVDTPGAAVYAKYCALCHGRDATGYAADNAPSLVSPTFLASASDDFLLAAIRNGRPGTAMAGYDAARGGPLSAQDQSALLVFLRSHQKVSPPMVERASNGNAERGAAIWRQHCTVCHGDRLQRGDAVHLANPNFIGSVSDSFLRYAIEYGRPGTRMTSFAITLPPAAIEDVIAFIRTWDPARPAPPTPPPPPQIDRGQVSVPKNLPPLRFPKGPSPTFKLREDRFVAADDVKAALDKKSRLIVLDARAVPDWIDAHIPGALPTPYYDFKYLDALPKDGTWIVAYCACPHHASGAVVDELRRRGYKNTAVLDEGILYWRQKNYPTERGD